MSTPIYMRLLLLNKKKHLGIDSLIDMPLEEIMNDGNLTISKQADAFLVYMSIHLYECAKRVVV